MKGEAKLPKAAAAPDLRKAEVEALVGFLAHPQQAVRMRALDELTDRIGNDAVVASLQSGFLRGADPNQRALCLWGLHRLGRIDDGCLEKALSDREPRVRVHALRVVAETPEDLRRFQGRIATFAERGLKDPDAFVQRAAADALATHPYPHHVVPLLHLLESAPQDDLFLRHVALIALRNQLQDESTLTDLRGGERPDEQGTEWIARACMGVRSETAGSFLFDRLAASNESKPADRATIAARLGHAADPSAPPSSIASPCSRGSASPATRRSSSKRSHLAGGPRPPRPRAAAACRRLGRLADRRCARVRRRTRFRLARLTGPRQRQEREP
jgi:HEAT repeat protein